MRLFEGIGDRSISLRRLKSGGKLCQKVAETPGSGYGSVRRASLGLFLLTTVACGSSATAGTVPDLVGENEDFGRGVLTAAGLVPDVVSADSDEPEGTIVGLVPEVGETVEDGAVVVVKVSPGPTTTTSEATTTTLAPVPDPNVIQYFEGVAGRSDTGFVRAADVATGRARTYVEYLAAAILPEDQTGLAEFVGPDSVDACYPDDDGGEYCITYDNFVVSRQGMVAGFDVNGTPLQQLMWPESDLDREGICRHYEGDDCDFSNPELGRSMYLLPRYAYVSTSGSLVVVIDMIAGQRDLDLLFDDESELLEVTATSDGSPRDLVGWYTNPNVSVASSLGLRIPKNLRTNLVLMFDGYGTTASATDIEIRLDWGGRSTFEMSLPALSR